MQKTLLFITIIIALQATAQRSIVNFNSGWRFLLGNDSLAFQPSHNDTKWHQLSLPHDWSIELPFSKTAPATNQGGALPGGIGWYRKTFTVPTTSKNKRITIEFDGIYRNSEVWINGHYLGKRPSGYSSFQYDLTQHLNYNQQPNIIAVKVDNSQQPNSRWYTGSGIYRNVRLVTTNTSYISYNGVFICTPNVTKFKADVVLNLEIRNFVTRPFYSKIQSVVYNQNGKPVVVFNSNAIAAPFEENVKQCFAINNPKLWSVDKPYLYKLVTTIYQNNIAVDQYSTKFGIRYFNFDVNKGFSLNGKYMKIKGVCMHHDLGALGAAINVSAIERQLRILKEMGCNAIRTAHNAPAPELLDACDRMGFLVMDEAFDMWKKKKNKYDYYSDFAEWHKQDLEDQIKRDRNHPSVFVWSIGNEIREQFDSTGIAITKELVSIVKVLDTTRPVTAALSEWNPEKNFMYKADALDLVGLNYHHEVYADFQKHFPGKKFIGTETMSALASRGHYDMPSDSMRFWPQKSPMKYVEGGNADFTVSAYDNVAAYWGSSHETTWKIIKKYDFLSGLFVWTGFDYLGEPTPYPYPARSSYFGIVDLAGFPKDAYYMYQSEWTDKPMLHLFPHWNWKIGQTVDVWAYYNNADEVELFLNGKSLGVKRKENDDLHVMWRVEYKPGTLKAISRKNRKIVLAKEIKTADTPYAIQLRCDKNISHQANNHISFVTVTIVDKNGNIVPNADNAIQFSLQGQGIIVGVDNGDPANLSSFKASDCKAYNGKCLVMIKKERNSKDTLILKAQSTVLPTSLLQIKVE
ncbi:MAG: glycoside hydrolase family 2 TIM barrel-domain containing protein [Flavobacterium sp.]|nr:glycoside hydrolase family 2 TIM barrel-domain containing protein [Flavobacterium sp.]